MMTRDEEIRLNQFKRHINKGLIFFDQLESFYQTVEVLNNDDIFARSANTIRLKYLNRHYLLELTFNEASGLGQIVVYKSEEGTEFWPDPKFIRKEECLIFFDMPGNIILGGGRPHPYPDRAAEDIIREITK